MTENEILVVSDMNDRRITLMEHPELVGVEWIFSCRDGHKLRGWRQDKIHITVRASLNMSPAVENMIAYRKAQGVPICPVS